ncbi:putative oxygen-independent coproporphyrinogen III oxidase [Olsenella sp. DNF00959]|nr:putative oxygen-independent coproporphyrinogen III oxidase [Olsenella sp. DNF00959]
MGTPRAGRTSAVGDGPSPNAWEGRLHATAAEALYLHLPFCESKCAYCDFASWVTREGDPLMGAYARALGSQVRELKGAGLLSSCRTAYLGGGTPSLLGTDGLSDLVRAVASTTAAAELSVEANPESLAEGMAGALAEAGATRVSLGVQSLDDGELRLLGRAHDARTALRALGDAVSSGLDVSCDLMCAIPRQTSESWARSLRGVLGEGVGHVSVYPLAIEDGTAFGRAVDEGLMDEPEDGLAAELMEEAERILGEAGLSRYEVASYARPGRACAHNQAYWTGHPYLGLGCSASGMLAREGYLRLRDACCPQLPEPAPASARLRLRVLTGRRAIAEDPRLSSLSFEVEELDAGQAAAEDLMLGARMTRGLDPALVSHARLVLGGGCVQAALDDCVARGLLARDGGGRLAPTHRGWLLGNELYGTLWDLAGGETLTSRCQGCGAPKP